MKKLTAVILALLIIILTIYGCSRAAGNGQGIDGVNKYGTLILDTTFEDMNAGGIEVGDIITARVGDNEYFFPVGTLYTDVDRGEMICRFDPDDKLVSLADIGRNEYAMTAMEEEGIRSVINLEDSMEEMHSFSTYAGSYYSSCAIANPEMDYEFGNEEFGDDIRKSILFI